MNVTLSAEIISLAVVAFLAGIALCALVLAVSRRWSERIGLWLLIVILASLAIALVLIPYQFERLALFALVAVTTAYAIFTFQQVQASKQMIGEMKAQRLADMQARVILKSVVKSPESQYFSHFVVWNVGNGPALELDIMTLDDNRNYIHARRETFLRPGEEYWFTPGLGYRLPETKYKYVLCQYKQLLYPTTEEVWDQVWLPFNLTRASKEGEVYVATGELHFKSGVSKKDTVVFNWLRPE